MAGDRLLVGSSGDAVVCSTALVRSRVLAAGRPWAWVHAAHSALLACRLAAPGGGQRAPMQP